MKRIHLFLVGILFLLCLVPLSQACSDDSPEIPVPPTPENPDPPTATWKNITAAPDNWDGTKRADQLEGYGAKVELALALGKKISDGYDQK
jgi:hypothetical protein